MAFGTGKGAIVKVAVGVPHQTAAGHCVADPLTIVARPVAHPTRPPHALAFAILSPKVAAAGHDADAAAALDEALVKRAGDGGAGSLQHKLAEAVADAVLPHASVHVAVAVGHGAHALHLVVLEVPFVDVSIREPQRAMAVALVVNHLASEDSTVVIRHRPRPAALIACPKANVFFAIFEPHRSAAVALVGAPLPFVAVPRAVQHCPLAVAVVDAVELPLVLKRTVALLKGRDAGDAVHDRGQDAILV